MQRQGGVGMKGIILAGGTGTRLSPLTQVFNKHLLPIGRYPMIVHPVMQMVKAGITDILLVTTPNAVGFLAQLFSDGEQLGVTVTYRVQDRPLGIAQGLSLARPFVQRDLCMVILGDNIFTDDLKPDVERFSARGRGAHIFVKRVADPTRYGVAEVQGDRILHIEEKPKHPTSHYAVTGIYLYDNRVFDIIDSLTPSTRGEYEITDINNTYVDRGELTFGMLEGDWVDAGTFSSIMLANQLMFDRKYPEFT